MPQRLALLLGVWSFAQLATVVPASAQFGGGMGGGAGGAGGAPPAVEKQRFRDLLHERGGPALRRESGGAVVAGVEIRGNQTVGDERILALLQTRPERVFESEIVLSDVRKLYEFGAFDTVRHRVEDRPEGKWVVFEVTERPTISKVIFHGEHGMNERELSGRAGLTAGDPLNEFAIESAVRRLTDYYLEQGFNQVVVQAVRGEQGDGRAVVFRINEGPKERINEIEIIGNTIEGDPRLKKIIRSRESFMQIVPWIGNTANLQQIDEDVDRLTMYYRNLGFLKANVGRQIRYDDSGKWLTVTFVIEEGERFFVNDVRIVGNKFVEEPKLRERLALKAGDPYSGVKMQLDVGELIYGYGSLGFIYAEVEPQLSMLDDSNRVDLVYRIEEGDRWKVGQIFVNIEGEPHLMRETMLLNQVELVEGQFIDRRQLEMDRRRLMRLQLFEENPAVADPVDIKIVPREEEFDF